MKIHSIVILAGGDGDRFYPLEQKMRFRFNGKTLLQHIVEAVASLAHHIIIITNDTNKSLIQADLSDYQVQYVSQTTDKGGMADAVLAAESYLTQDVLFLNGNDMIDFSIIPSLISQTNGEKTLLGFVAKRVATYLPTGYVRFDGERAVEIIEKPLPADVPSEYARLVVDYFPKATDFIKELKALPATDDQYEKGMSALMKQLPATCFKYEGDWATVKYSWQILSMQEYFFSHHLEKTIAPSSVIHKTATIEGDVYVGKNVKIGAYVKITGPCYIGNDVTVGDHSLLRSSTIGNDSLVGSGCEIARSYLCTGVMLHRNYVGDSVLSEGTTMGAGAVSANYRFDAKNIQTPVGGKMVDSQKGKFGLIAGAGVKIGVNVSTYPGVKLAANTVVLPGEVVTKDR